MEEVYKVRENVATSFVDSIWKDNETICDKNL